MRTATGVAVAIMGACTPSGVGQWCVRHNAPNHGHLLCTAMDRAVLIIEDYEADVQEWTLREAARYIAYEVDWDGVPESVENWLLDRAEGER